MKAGLRIGRLVWVLHTRDGYIVLQSNLAAKPRYRFVCRQS